MNQFHGQKIGVWGYGQVGKSVVQLLQQFSCTLSVYDQRVLTTNEQALLPEHTITYSPETLNSFLQDNDYIVPSPGVDLHAYLPIIRHKLISELDIFSAFFNRPSIAITGSIGKTSITHLLDQLLNRYGTSVLTGGNIGLPLLNLISQQGSVGLLELSSFQLEHSKQFAPDIGILTNVYPNHFDRHHSEHAYLQAKLNMFAHQTSLQKALIPLALYSRISSLINLKSRMFLFAPHDISDDELHSFHHEHTLFFIRNNIIVKTHNYTPQPLLALRTLPNLTFAYNWLILVAVIDMLSLDIAMLASHAQGLSLPEHRMEFLGTVNDVTFYNDSKSTTPASTLAAIEQCTPSPILLFVGGLSKGIDREPLFKHLSCKIKHIFIFGAEAELLASFAHRYHLPFSTHTTLDDAFTLCTKQVTVDDVVLFSPAGSSFDLFAHYIERGNYFKKLVHNYTNTNSKEDDY